MKSEPRILSFIGWSGTGKTSFIEALLRECASRGITAATAKKSRHEANIAPEAKDSERFFTAGASPSVYLDEKSMLVLSRKPENLDAEALAALCPDADLILCEGLELPGCPLVIVAGGAAKADELKRGLGEATALIAEDPALIATAACAGIPCFAPGQAGRLLEWILAR